VMDTSSRQPVGDLQAAHGIRLPLLPWFLASSSGVGPRRPPFPSRSGRAPSSSSSSSSSPHAATHQPRPNLPWSLSPSSPSPPAAPPPSDSGPTPADFNIPPPFAPRAVIIPPPPLPSSELLLLLLLLLVADPLHSLPGRSRAQSNSHPSQGEVPGTQSQKLRH
jgi:hypothetical protein